MIVQAQVAHETIDAAKTSHSLAFRSVRTYVRYVTLRDVRRRNPRLLIFASAKGKCVAIHAHNRPAVDRPGRVTGPHRRATYRFIKDEVAR